MNFYFICSVLLLYVGTICPYVFFQNLIFPYFNQIIRFLYVIFYVTYVVLFLNQVKIRFIFLLKYFF